MRGPNRDILPLSPGGRQLTTMKQQKLDVPAILSRLSMFQELAPDQHERIAAATLEKRLDKGEILFQKGDPPKGFYVVVAGQLKLAFPSLSGHEKIVDILGPGHSFGEAVMFMENQPYPVFAQALSDSVLLHVAKAAIFDLLSSDASFARRMLAGMSLRLHSLIRDVESYSLRSSTQRVIGFLLQHCPQDQDSGSKLAITLPASKQVIASRLNLTPETLSRIFHELTEHQLIAVHGREVTVLDTVQLREFDL